MIAMLQAMWARRRDQRRAAQAEREARELEAEIEREIARLKRDDEYRAHRLRRVKEDARDALDRLTTRQRETVLLEAWRNVPPGASHLEERTLERAAVLGRLLFTHCTDPEEGR